MRPAAQVPRSDSAIDPDTLGVYPSTTAVASGAQERAAAPAHTIASSASMALRASGCSLTPCPSPVLLEARADTASLLGAAGASGAVALLLLLGAGGHSYGYGGVPPAPLPHAPPAAAKNKSAKERTSYAHLRGRGARAPAARRAVG